MGGEAPELVGRSVAFKTLGCKVNQFDTEAIRNQFLEAGFRAVDFEERADVYVLNSCTVTAESDRECRRLARQAAKRNPQATVVVTGCYAQRAPEALRGLPEVHLLLGTQEKPAVLEHLLEFWRGGPSCVVSDFAAQASFPRLSVPHFSDRTRAYLKVQEGCSEGCTFCAIPRGRGPARSLPLEEAVSQAKRLLLAGHRELVIMGVLLGSYGRDLPGPERPTLASLLRRLSSLAGVGRIRLSSIEPRQVTEELIAVIAESTVLCNHLHIPLQSGSAAVLRRMGRPYDPGYYADLTARLRRSIPQLGLGADVMVGFPGETEAEFEETLRFVQEQPFTYLHVFAYSPREGTPAADLPRQVADEVKKERSRRLRALALEKAAEFRRSLLGSTQRVLFERARSGEMEGLTDTYVRVRLTQGPAQPNALVSVRIIGERDGILLGATESVA